MTKRRRRHIVVMRSAEPRGDAGVGNLDERRLESKQEVLLAGQLTAERRELNVFLLKGSV